MIDDDWVDGQSKSMKIGKSNTGSPIASHSGSSNSNNLRLSGASGSDITSELGGKQKKSKFPLTLKQFEVIFQNKIQPNLEEQGKFTFEDLWTLVNAYDYWQYENINKSTFGQI